MYERPLWYRRDGTPVNDMMEWAAGLKEEDRRVDGTLLWWGGRVSTVFLGLDHSFFGGPPLIFETMVFPPGWMFWRHWGSMDMNRYSTEAQAQEGHKQMVRQWANPWFLIKAIAEDIWREVKWKVFKR